MQQKTAAEKSDDSHCIIKIVITSSNNNKVMDNLGITYRYSICLFQAKITFEEATSTGQAAFFLLESKYAGDIFVCKLGNLDAGETAVLTMAYVVELTVQPDGDLNFELPYVLNTRYSSGQSIQAQTIYKKTISFIVISCRHKGRKGKFTGLQFRCTFNNILNINKNDQFKDPQKWY